MRTILTLLGLLLCANVAAGPINSSASGVYIGSDRVCRIMLARYEVQWTQVDIRCLHFAGGQSQSLTTVYSPGNCPQGGAYSLTPWAPGEYLSLRAFDPVQQALSIVRGTDQTAVTNGVGIAETWHVIGFAPSPAPYSCGGSTYIPPPPVDPHALARFCRAYPDVPACRG